MYIRQFVNNERAVEFRSLLSYKVKFLYTLADKLKKTIKSHHQAAFKKTNKLYKLHKLHFCIIFSEKY